MKMHVLVLQVIVNVVHWAVPVYSHLMMTMKYQFNPNQIKLIALKKKKQVKVKKNRLKNLLQKNLIFGKIF